MQQQQPQQPQAPRKSPATQLSEQVDVLTCKQMVTRAATDAEMRRFGWAIAHDQVNSVLFRIFIMLCKLFANA